MPEANGEGSPRGELTTQESSWYDRPHAELVEAFRNFIKDRDQRLGGAYSPEEIIRNKLQGEWMYSPDKTKREFFFQLHFAWDALAYNRYKLGSSAEHLAGTNLQSYYGDTHEASVAFADPLQVKIIDALADATGIVHETSIAIPPHLRNYNGWVMSDEYHRRVVDEKARRG
jgi:hypothetical protein